MSLDQLASTPVQPKSQNTLATVGLFAGIGGLELGLAAAGHKCELLCEIDPAAKFVLSERFRGTPLVSDIREIDSLPAADLVVAGFPCQDLSQAGRTAGINGIHSGLVEWIFRLIKQSRHQPEWILLENVPFMLRLNRGAAIGYLVDQLEELGYSWAYRTIDTRAFGLPQRRRRVFLLASLTQDPRSVLLTEDVGEPVPCSGDAAPCGFYWTEGNRGLGWAVDAVPPLKGSSGVGIPAPPGIWLPQDRTIVTPDIRDAERLQGFDKDWTQPAVNGRGGRQVRWRLVGNAVSVPVAKWIGERLNDTLQYEDNTDRLLASKSPWPDAGWGRQGVVYAANRSSWPVQIEQQHLDEFLQHPTSPLSVRATSGFLSRLQKSSLRAPNQFKCDLAYHASQMMARIGETL